MVCLHTEMQLFPSRRLAVWILGVSMGIALLYPAKSFGQVQACCSLYGCYDNLTTTACTAAGDTPMGSNTSCDNTSEQLACAPVGACCTSTTTCVPAQTESQCGDLGGIYLADGELCSPGICSPLISNPDCGGECLGVCVGPPAIPEEITLRKKIDIAVYNGADANGPSRLKILLKHAQVNRRARVANVNAAIKSIKAIWRRLGKNPLNVAVSGHGAPGNQQVGTEIIGNQDQNAEDAKTDFITSLNGMIKDIVLLGCSTADGKKGQDFLAELANGLGAVDAKGYTDVVYLDVATNSYTTDGAKKKFIPAVSEWGLAVMLLLVLSAGTIVIVRKRRTIMA